MCWFFPEFNCLDIYYCRNHSGCNIPAAGDPDLDRSEDRIVITIRCVSLWKQKDRSNYRDWREALMDAGLDPDDYDDF